MSRVALLAVGLFAVTSVGLAQPEAPASPTPPRSIAEIPVVFDVVNTNRTSIPCLSDGKHYEVRGHLIGPTSALVGEASQERLVSVLLTGWDSGEWMWRFQDVPGYDYPHEMAKLGHISLSLDVLGYGASGWPRGSEVCWGSHADVLHQIVQQLRHGTYRALAPEGAVRFTRIVLSAHDIGPLAAVAEAYTWNDVDGITTQLWAHQGFEPYIISIFTQRLAQCALGGEGKDDPKSNPTPGGEYVFFGPPDDQFRHDLFLEDENATGPGGADPAVIEAVIRLRERNPCGQVTSTPAAIRMNLTNMPTIRMPVLLVFPGPDDPVVSRSGEEAEANNYGSNDVTSAWLDSGHFMMLERCASKFRLLTAHWLHQRWQTGDDVPMPPVGPHECVTEVRLKHPSDDIRQRS